MALSMSNQNTYAHAKGILYATIAAALNGTIGVFSKYLFASDLPPAGIALFKSVIGFAFLLFLVPSRIESLRSYLRAAVCAFFGIFMLFYFETSAYHYEIAANVVFTLMATAALTAFVLGAIFIGDKPNRLRWIGLGICTLGLAIFLGASRPSNLIGLIYAAIAGAGYGVFSVLAKKLKLGSGLAVTRRLLMFGGLYLTLPFFIDHNQLSVIQTFSSTTWFCLAMLALLPSIGGFYCTTRAIELTTPAQVQLFELSEPLFAAGLAWLVLQETPTMSTALGGMLVVVGLFVSQQEWWKKGLREQRIP
jgi:DME family drug/metabolite transporter